MPISNTIQHKKNYPEVIRRKYTKYKRIPCYFLCILHSGEFCRKGDSGCLNESMSFESIFISTGLVIFGLDFRLLLCNKFKQITRLNQMVIMPFILFILILPWQMHCLYVFRQSHQGCILGDVASIIFCSPHSICCFLQIASGPAKENISILSYYQQPEDQQENSFLGVSPVPTSSSALVRLILRCSLSF